MNRLKQLTTTGYLPPQALDLEEAVLGALMLEKTALLNVSDILNDECFYKPNHQKIYSAIITLSNNAIAIDILTVCEQLKKDGNLESIGGFFYITELTNRVASAANIEFHAKIIKQKFIQRDLIRLGTEIIKNSYDDTSDPFETIEYSTNNLYEMISGTLGRDFVTFDSLVSERYKLYCEGLKEGLTGISTGLSELDEITNGWQNNNLIILAARPAMGKTAMALHFIRNAAINQNLPVAIFSLEMSKEQLSDRIISAESEVELEAIKRRNLRNEQKIKIEKTSNKLFNCKIVIDESSTLTINQVKAKAIRLKQKHDIKLIVVDYLQLLSGSNKKGANREQEISEISRGLKHIAKDLNIPVIALSQLSRAVESRPGGNKKPMLSDLRESGSIEQDADVVMFLYRPEYYGIEEDENGNSTFGLTEIIIAKNRDGIVDTARCKFVGKFQRFENENESFDPFEEISENINTMPQSSKF